MREGSGKGIILPDVGPEGHLSHTVSMEIKLVFNNIIEMLKRNNEIIICKLNTLTLSIS